LTVTRALFEAPGPTTLRTTTGVHTLSAAARLLRQGRDLSARLGHTASRLMQDTMSKGLIMSLVRRGGWRRAESVRDGQVRTGRLWERHHPPALHLSPFAMHLCRWLTAHELGREPAAPLVHAPATVADELLLYLALDLAHRARCTDALAIQPGVRASALCWLGFADVLARHVDTDITPADISVYAFVPWTSGTGALIVEALQPDLAARWITMERHKRALGSSAAIIATGRVQEAVLKAWGAALGSAGRRDLIEFVLLAARALLDERTSAQDWRPAADPGAPLQTRNHAQRAAAAFLRALRPLKRWADNAAAVRFFDDEYSAAQLYLRLWEQLGGSRYRRAMALVTELESARGLV
jgi:hypothetical protein